VESHTIGIIPFDDRVIFVSLLNCAEFPSRLSEVAQTLNAIFGLQVLDVWRWLGEAWLLGTVWVMRCAWVCQGRLGSFTQFRYRLIGDMGHLPLFLSKSQGTAIRRDCSALRPIQDRLEKNGWAGSNCSVLKLNSAKCSNSAYWNGSDHLDSLAEQHPVVSDAFIIISGSVRNTATLLEVLGAMKIVPLSLD